MDHHNEQEQGEEEEEEVKNDNDDVQLTTSLCERLINRTVLATPTTTDNEPKKPTMVDATIFRHPDPACLHHGKQKGRWRHEVHDDCCKRPSSTNCQYHWSVPYFRIKIANDPLATLKRWIINHNRTLDGDIIPRDSSLLFVMLGVERFNYGYVADQSEFQPHHLRHAIAFAIEQITSNYAEEESLREYVSRPPYRYPHVAGGAADRLAQAMKWWPSERQTAHMTLEQLCDWLFKMAKEYDNSRQWIERMTEVVVNAKWQEAERGNEGEIQDLLKLNFVDKEMVAQHCGCSDSERD